MGIEIKIEEKQRRSWVTEMGVFVQIGHTETAVTCSMKQAHNTERQREDRGGDGRREAHSL